MLVSLVETLIPAPERASHPGIRLLAPGAALSVAVAGVSLWLGSVIPVISPLIVAIVAGVVLANTVRLPAATHHGIAFSAKTLLRAGIVLLGLQLAWVDIRALGVPLLVVVLVIVTTGIGGTLLLGRLLRVQSSLTVLIACGFSICGAAAIAGATGVTDPRDENRDDTATAIGLVVVFGTAMIGLIPLLAYLIGLSERVAGMWAGGAIHEVAQVVAAGGVIGGGALAVAVAVKLARVLTLAPVVTVLSVRQRFLVRASKVGEQPAHLPPLVPGFVLGFVGLVLVRSLVPIPEFVLQAGESLQTLLLAAAMFALGCGVSLKRLTRVGARPFALAGCSTILVSTVALVGMVLVG